MGTFNLPKDQVDSPIPSTMQRNQPSRGRQNSTQSALVEASRNRPSSSTSSKQTNGNGIHSTHIDLEKVAGLTGKTVGDVKSNLKEVASLSEEHLIENGGDGAGDLRGGLLVGNKSQDKSLKHEEIEIGPSRSRADRPPSISTSTRGGKASKTATPVTTSFPEPQRPRSSRNSEMTMKRSHKKGAGLAAQLAAAAAAVDEEGSSIQDDEDDEEDDNEPKYCYCNRISFGEMVACDSNQCKIEWFHLRFVPLLVFLYKLY